MAHWHYPPFSYPPFHAPLSDAVCIWRWGVSVIKHGSGAGSGEGAPLLLDWDPPALLGLFQPFTHEARAASRAEPDGAELLPVVPYCQCAVGLGVEGRGWWSCAGARWRLDRLIKCATGDRVSLRGRVKTFMNYEFITPNVEFRLTCVVLQIAKSKDWIHFSTLLNANIQLFQ